MGLLTWLFGEDAPRSDDEISDLRPALATMIKRCLRDQSQSYELKVWRCSINDVPVGSWRFTVERIPDEKEPTEPSTQPER